MKAKSTGNQPVSGTVEQQEQSVETHYRMLFNHAPVGIFIADTEGYYLDANEAMCRVLGYTRKELIGLHASDIVDQSKIQHISPALNEIKTRSDYRREWRFRRKDGSVFSAEVTATTMPDGNLLGMVRDISEHKSVEEEINFKNTILQTQQETSLDAILVVGENDLVLSYNQQFIDLWGISPQLVSAGLDAPVLQFCTEQVENLEAFVAKVKYLYAHHGENSRDEIRLKDGRIVDRYSAPIIDADEKYFGRIWYFRDVTESKRAQQSLQTSEREQRQLAQQLEAERARLVAAQRIAMVGSWETDLATLAVIWSGETYHIFEIDPAGFHPTHQDFIELVHPEDRAAVDKAFARSIEQRSNGVIEHRLLMLDGRIKFVEENWQIFLDDQGKPARALGTCQDITERKQAASAFEELSRKTEQRERMLSSALSSMSDFAQIYDHEGRILYANQPLLDLWGITLEEAIGRNFFELGYPEELAERLQRQLRDVFETGQRVTDETSYVGSDGRLGYYEYIFSPVLDADQSVGFVVGSTRNITGRKHSEAALRASELRYHSLFENMLEGYAYCGTIFEQDVLSDFVYLAVNDAFGRLTGLKDVVGKKISDVIPGARKDNAELFEIYGRVALTGQPEKSETYLPALGVWLSITVYSSDRWHFVVVFENITERKESEARIRYLNRVYAVLSGINTLIVHARDRDELYKGACRIAVEAGGFRMAMVCILDRNTGQIVPVASEGKDEDLMTVIKNTLSSEERVSKTMVARAIRDKKAVISNDSLNDPGVLIGQKYAESGVRSIAVLPLIVSDEAVGAFTLYAGEIEFFHDDEMKLLTELVGDIAFAIDHIEKQERLNYLAYYDVLTGLANRNLFLERVEQLIRAADSDGQRFAIGLIDLERFKNINDSLGRPAGDALLKQVAEWLTRFAHDANLLARLDADHFAFVVPEVKAGGNLAGLFDRVAQTFLAHPFRVGGTELRLAAKTGIALFPDDGTDAETVLGNAEAALKIAKKSGHRYLFHTKKMTEAVAAKLTLENQLRQAIDNEEFVLHYQPKVNLVSGKVTGAEALIRWNDPRTGLVPPGKFIPVLEETGLISEVGRWALRKAIEDYLRWRAAGLKAVRIAVNVSPLQLRNPGFVAEIERKIGIGAHAAEGLELEITESMIMEDVKHSVSSLRAIRDMGVHVAIDDFGTGFSSLGYLSKLPIDTLKIDRSFVIDMTAGPQGLALVTTIINLAHALKLKVVAEGVETEEQSGLLHLLNCDEMQGFLFSKPVPADIFEARFLSQA